MKTSALLFRESGEPIHDFHLSFSAHRESDECEGPTQIAGSLVIEGIAQPSSVVPTLAFLQPIDRPFAIDADDVVYLNADCHYGEDALIAIAQGIARDGGPGIRFVSALPDQLDGLDLGLSGTQRQAFRLGRPIWCRGARSSVAGKGQRAYSPATLALRDAIQAWTVIGEQIIRFSFERAQREGVAFRNRHQNLAASAERLIGLALGYYYPSRARFDVDVPDLGDVRLVLERYRYKTTHNAGRKRQFVRARRGRVGRLGPTAPSQFPRYAAMPGQIADVLGHDVASFEDRHAGCRFDPLALAKWSAKILIHLRIAHSAVLSVDRKRAAVAKTLREALTPEDLQLAVDRFTFEPLMALRALRQPDEKGRRKHTVVGLNQLVGLQEAVIIAMLADLDPRVLNPDILSNPEVVRIKRPHVDALLETARWLGRLYRERHGVMSLPQAQRLCWLAGYHDLAADEAAELRVEIATMLSYLTPDGRDCLWEGATSVVRDGLARSVFVTTPRPAAPVVPAAAATLSLADLAREIGGGASSLPDPIMVSGGYLLVPGDFAEVWQGRSRDLMTSLRDPAQGR